MYCPNSELVYFPKQLHSQNIDHFLFLFRKILQLNQYLGYTPLDAMGFRWFHCSSNRLDVKIIFWRYFYLL